MGIQPALSLPPAPPARRQVVFAVHPPGETLHLASLGVPAVPGTRAAPVLSALIGGLRLPYLLVTGVGWQDWLHNAPVQVGRAGALVPGWGGRTVAQLVEAAGACCGPAFNRSLGNWPSPP